MRNQDFFNHKVKSYARKITIRNFNGKFEHQIQVLSRPIFRISAHIFSTINLSVEVNTVFFLPFLAYTNTSTFDGYLDIDYKKLPSTTIFNVRNSKLCIYIETSLPSIFATVGEIFRLFPKNWDFFCQHLGRFVRDCFRKT